MRRQRSTMKRESRTCVSKSMSLEEATTSALTERWKSVTSSGRSSISSTSTWTSGWLVVTALQICLRMVVLPVRGGATIRPRVPLPMGVTRSITRVSSRSGVVSRLNFSMGSMVVRFSKRTALVYSSKGHVIDLVHRLELGAGAAMRRLRGPHISCPRAENCAGWCPASQKCPSVWDENDFAAVRRKPKPFSEFPDSRNHNWLACRHCFASRS